jgi:hypothetical protein
MRRLPRAGCTNSNANNGLVSIIETAKYYVVSPYASIRFQFTVFGYRFGTVSGITVPGACSFRKSNLSYWTIAAYGTKQERIVVSQGGAAMREHIRILGILNIVMGCLTACGGIVLLIVMGGAARLLMAAVGVGDEDAANAAPIIATIGICIGIFLLVLAAPAIIGGWGLLNFRPWSRVLMIVLSILHLIHVPLGTALGVYGLWVLFSDEGRRLLETGGYYAQPVPGSYAPPLVTPPQGSFPTQPPR